MNKKLFVVFACVLMVILTGCQSVKVDRIDADTTIDLSGYWNDADIRIVSDSLVKECVNAPAIDNYIRNNRMLPVVIVGTFRNDTDEHIDTSIIVKKFEAALINSGKVEFVASSSERQEIREERMEQQEWASEETAKRLANEYGADFMLIGSVKTSVDMVDNKTVRTYFVYAELIDIETNRKLWMGENSEIKKLVTKSAFRG